MVARDRGTPQGGVISPLLANLFLHYAFDRWVQTEYPEVPFERYADDVVCHCRTKQQAEKFLSALRERLTACGLTLHPEKTRLVYCKDGRRREEHLHTKFDFLGFSFHASDDAKPRGTIVHWVRACGESKGTEANVSGHQKHESQSKYLIDAARVSAASEPNGSGMGELLWCFLSRAAETVLDQNRLAAWRMGAKQVQAVERA